MINPSKSNYKGKLPPSGFHGIPRMAIPAGESPPFRNEPHSWLPIHNFKAKYHSISNLGNGSFGSVELAKYRLNKSDLLAVSLDKKNTLMDPLDDAVPNLTGLVAIKTMKKKLPNLADYSKVKEVKFILSISSHPCLVQIYEMFIDDINFQLHISMESLTQNLYQLMKARRNVRFSPVTLKSILSQILCAIGHIHKNGYFHRDVKPENILVVPTSQYYGPDQTIPPHRKNDNFVVKLADYGLARHISNTKIYTAYVSTRWYRSPEILLRQRSYSRPIDIWAFGCVAAEIANFSPLFPGSNELDQLWRILKALGSPILYHSYEHADGSQIFPLGGQWDDAETLASKVGFAFPPELGITIQDIFPNPVHSELADVVKACLTWDPNTRATYDELASMRYFKNSMVSLTHGENELFEQYENIKAWSPYEVNENRTKVPHKLIEGSVVYEDLDDGYEVQFMKENRASVAAQLFRKIEATKIVYEEDDNGDDGTLENSLKLEYSFHTQPEQDSNANSDSNTSGHEYSWGPGFDNKQPQSIKVDQSDEIDDSYDQLQDVSFEINV